MGGVVGWVGVVGIAGVVGMSGVVGIAGVDLWKILLRSRATIRKW